MAEIIRERYRIGLLSTGARGFYEKLGWRRANDDEGVAFYQAGGMVLALWGRDELAEDSRVVDSGGWGGVSLAYNVGSPEEVDATIEEARRAGATISKEPGPTDWGGYHGVFVDPDGHPWEVAHNPFWTIGGDGGITL